MKCLIVDDELLARITVQKLLNDCGIENDSIQIAENGEEMIQILSGKETDIAFVDIRMPDISGLAAIRKCLNVSPETSYYILTGYEKFEYAAEAIRLGVKDFLLKPLTVQAVAEILDREASLSVKKEALITDTLLAGMTRVILGEAPSSVHALDGIVCLPCFLTTSEAPGADLTALEQIHLLYSMVHLVMLPYENESVACFCLKKEYTVSAVASEIVRQVQKLPAQKGNSTLTITYSGKFIAASEISPVLRELRDYADLRITSGMGRAYRYRSSSEQDTGSQASLAHAIMDFYQAYELEDYSVCSRSVKTLSAMAAKVEANQDVVPVKQICEWLDQVFQDSPKMPCSLEKVISFFQSRCDHLLSRNDSQSISFSTILEYIDAHFAEDISVSSVAAVFDLSANYLSTLFKKESGIRFTDYVTMRRVTEAKRLLRETNLQVKEIAERTGYYTASHFIRIFVKSEGVTPLEYRKA